MVRKASWVLLCAWHWAWFWWSDIAFNVPWFSKKNSISDSNSPWDNRNNPHLHSSRMAFVYKEKTNLCKQRSERVNGWVAYLVGAWLHPHLESGFCVMKFLCFGVKKSARKSDKCKVLHKIYEMRDSKAYAAFPYIFEEQSLKLWKLEHCLKTIPP